MHKQIAIKTGVANRNIQMFSDIFDKTGFEFGRHPGQIKLPDLTRA